jgi:SAM-dependent methyltransferase
VNTARQEETAVTRNREFFASEKYGNQVAEFDTYQMIRRAISDEVAGTRHLLDIGNGGVFEYDTEGVESIVAVDLFLSELDDELPDNVVARDGDALHLDEPDEEYDAVLQAFLFHHLVGDTAPALVDNVRTAISEATRVLKPGGRLIVGESCVPRWFYSFERVAFRPLVAISRTRLLGGHPATLQLPLRDLVALIAERLSVERAERIPTGRWVSQFGRRWPTFLTPARPYLIVATKESRIGQGRATI